MAESTTSPKSKGNMWMRVLKGAGSPEGLEIAGKISSTIDTYSAAQFNSLMAGYEGDFAYRMAQLDETRFRLSMDKVIGTAIANAGASGFALESESTQLAIDALVRAGEMDAAMIRIRGDIGKWKAEMEESEYDRQMTDSLVSGALNIGSTLISGYNNKSGAKAVSGRGPFT